MLRSGLETDGFKICPFIQFKRLDEVTFPLLVDGGNIIF